jgi:uncharacterized oxidoreductase
MFLISSQDLRARIQEIFCTAGSHPPIAERVADSLVESNLTGHDSHGVIRVPAYVDSIRKGTLQPNGQIQVVRESATTALLDCGWTFGQVAACRGIELAMEKAREHDMGLVVLRHCNHTGRIGEFAVAAAEQGFIGLVFCNGSVPGGLVTPFGGIKRALGANPLAWAIPRQGANPIFFDYATSVVSQGKILVAADKGERVPEGWILDKEGRPTTNPREMLEGGALLPFGGYKGYDLAVMIELLGAGLSGAGIPLMPGYKWDQGTVLLAIRIEAFRPLEEYNRMVEEFVVQLKAAPRAPDCAEILLPGEPEWRCKAQRERDGIPLPEATWGKVKETAKSLGLKWD